MSERKCMWCQRWQSEHEDMTFASKDHWCKCSLCLTGKSGKRGDAMTLPGAGAFVYVRRRSNNRIAPRTNRNDE